MQMYIGMLIVAMCGFIFISYDLVANTDSWGMFGSAHLGLYLGVLLVGLGLVGAVIHALDRK